MRDDLPAPGPDGLSDGSYYFSGRKTSYINFPNNGKLDSYYSLTLLAWVYPEGSGPIFHFAPGGVRFWVVRPNTLFVRFVRRTGRLSRQLISLRVIPKQWNSVGAAYDEKTGIATLWRNSRPIKSVYIGRICLATNRPSRMGALPRDLRYFRGRISCMQVYRVKLSGPEIKRAENVCFREREFYFFLYLVTMVGFNFGFKCGLQVANFKVYFLVKLACCSAKICQKRQGNYFVFSGRN